MGIETAESIQDEVSITPSQGCPGIACFYDVRFRDAGNDEKFLTALEAMFDIRKRISQPTDIGTLAETSRRCAERNRCEVTLENRRSRRPLNGSEIQGNTACRERDIFTGFPLKPGQFGSIER